MKNMFLPRIAFRFLFRSRSVGVLPWLTVFALLSVAVGVMTLIISLSVFNGFTTTLQEQMVGIYSPLRVYSKYDRLVSLDEINQDLDGLVDSHKIIGVREGEVLLRGGNDQYTGGRILAFSKWKTDRFNLNSAPENGLALGHILATNLSVFDGDQVTLIRPSAQETPFGMLPGGKSLQIGGVFRTGYQQLDEYLGVVSWENAGQLFDFSDDSASYVEVWVDDRSRAPDIKQVLSEKFSDTYHFVTWQESNRALFEALNLERTVMFIVLTLIVLVAAINILSMLVLSILQRRKQIAMMMAMGASPGTILFLFLLGGMAITVIGLFLGTVLGLTGCYLLDNVFVISLPPVYPMTQLPVEVSGVYILLITIVTLLLGFLSSFYPAWKASRIDPAEVLRYG